MIFSIAYWDNWDDNSAFQDAKGDIIEDANGKRNMFTL